MSTTMGDRDSQRKNIVIIGGGIIGSTSAYFLSRHPSYDPKLHSITLLEASKIAGGASGKAGGLLALWAYPSCLVPLSYRLHRELAEEHGGEERWGYRAVHCGSVECVGRKLEVGDVADRTNGTSGKRAVEGKDEDMNGENGTVDESKTRVSLQKLDETAKRAFKAANAPDDLDWIHPKSLRMYDEMGDPSTTAQVHPFQFTTAMAEIAAEMGVEVKTNARAERINYGESGKKVESVVYTDTESGEEKTIPATDIVVAAGPWTKNILPTAPISGMRAHSVTIRPSRPVSAFALFTHIKLPKGFWPTGAKSKWGEQHVSPEIYARPKNEVYACGEGDRLVPLPASTADVEVDEQRCQDIIDHVAGISDELRHGEVTARQACYLPNVDGSGNPLVGLTGISGLVLAAGHTCWGIQNGPATGKLVSEFVFDGRARSANVKSLDPRNALLDE